MDLNRCRSMLATLITEQQSHVSALLTLLEREQRILRENQREELEPVAREKQRLVKAIDEREAQRTALLKVLKLENSQAGMAELLQRLGNEPPLCQAWEQLIDDLGRCRKQNEVNGGAIELVKRHLQRAMTIIQGKSSAPTLYDDHGQTSAQFSGRSIARA